MFLSKLDFLSGRCFLIQHTYSSFDCFLFLLRKNITFTQLLLETLFELLLFNILCIHNSDSSGDFEHYI